MSAQIVRIKLSAGPLHIANATRLAAALEARGFDPNDIDDLVYNVATEICRTQAELLTDPSMRERAAIAEYTAADEINESSMVEQLTLLAAWHGSPQKFHDHLVAALRIEASALPDVVQDTVP